MNTSLFAFSYPDNPNISAVRCQLICVGEGYSRTSVNTGIFRTDSLVSYHNEQYIAYYDAAQSVIIGKRHHGSSRWQLTRTPYYGNCRDAHNSISLMVDGEGYLHLSFNQHASPLIYYRSCAPGSPEFEKRIPMLNMQENRVTYPEFYRFPDGDLLFVYRSGYAGSGNLVMNYYDTANRLWKRVHSVLLDGERQRNAYWQIYLDQQGSIHLSWIWRETTGVESNHDLGYACSHDKGKTWLKADGTPYELPIRCETTDYAWRIPPGHELINQTSISTDKEGHPYIATYWRQTGETIPQYRLVYFDGHSWQQQVVSRRTHSFSLSGTGTKVIPISRPRLFVCEKERKTSIFYIFRDSERNNRISLAYSPDIQAANWSYTDLTDFPVGSWEPSGDIEYWKKKQQLHLYVQHTCQGDGETITGLLPQPVYVLECRFE